MTTLNEWNVELIRIEETAIIELYSDIYKVSYSSIDATSKRYEYIEFENIINNIIEFDFTEIRKKLKPYGFKFLSICINNNNPVLRFYHKITFKN